MRAFTPVLMAAAAVLFHSQAHAGYTHYFTWRKLPSDAELGPCFEEMRLIVEARKSILVAPDDPGAVPGSPKIMASSVDFNGVGDDAHEPFVFPGQKGFNFCKTAAKPYDEVVTACLMVARDHFPASVLSISSDGAVRDFGRMRGATQKAHADGKLRVGRLRLIAVPIQNSESGMQNPRGGGPCSAINQASSERSREWTPQSKRRRFSDLHFHWDSVLFKTAAACKTFARRCPAGLCR